MKGFSSVVNSLIGLSLVLITLPSSGQNTNYIASIIELGETYQDFSVADLNGDKLNDVIVSNWHEDRGRELQLYFQQSDGKFSAQQSRRIELKRDIIAYAFADIRSEPGDELLFFTAATIFSYSSAHNSYSNNLQKVADWPLAGSVPSRRTVSYLGHLTSSKNTFSEKPSPFLLPGSEGFGLLPPYLNGENKSLNPINLPPPRRQPNTSSENDTQIRFNMDNGIKIEVNRPSDFEGLFVERLIQTPEINTNTFDGSDQNEYLLHLKKWTSNVQSAQITGDETPEYLYMDEDTEIKDKTNTVLNIVQVIDGKPKIIFQHPLENIDQLKLFDFNNDGLSDILATRINGSSDVSASIYINRSSSDNNSLTGKSQTDKSAIFQLDQADYVVKFSGYDVDFSLTDINNDNAPDLVVSAYQISALNALREGALVRSALIYAGNPNYSVNGNENALFERRPSFKLEENFNANDIKGLSDSIYLNLDTNVDGEKELVSLNKQGALTAKTITKNFKLNDNALWEFAPLHYVTGINPETLNSDNRIDFVLRHQHSLTVLVSQ